MYLILGRAGFSSSPIVDEVAAADEAGFRETKA
jgi:hypothetical protein